MIEKCWNVGKTSVAKKILLFLGGGIVLSLVFWLLLSMAYAIPQQLVQKNLEESAAILESEGDYPVNPVFGYERDNFTTVIMLEECVTKEGNPFFESLRNTYTVAEEGPRVSGLSKALVEDGSSSYSRYWHGYVVIIKPLLIFFNLQEIRILFQTALIVALGTVAVFMSRKINPYGFGLAFLLLSAVGLFTVVSAAVDLPLFFSLFLMLVGTLGVLLLNTQNVKRDRIVFFFILGALTVYFDFLDTPIVVLGVPLIVYLVRLKIDTVTNLELIKTVLLCSLFWFIGYGFLWCMKWFLAVLFLGPQVFSSVIGSISLRTGIKENDASVAASALDAIAVNVSRMQFVKYFMLVAFVGAFIQGVVFCKYNKHQLCSTFVMISLLVVIALLPYAWYLILSNHSTVHSWFTFRDQIVTLFSFLTINWWFGSRILIRQVR